MRGAEQRQDFSEAVEYDVVSESETTADVGVDASRDETSVNDDVNIEEETGAEAVGPKSGLVPPKEERIAFPKEPLVRA